MFWGVESGLLSHQNCNFSKSVLYLHHGQDQEESDDDNVQQVDRFYLKQQHDLGNLKSSRFLSIVLEQSP